MKTYKICEIENKRILGRNVQDAGNNGKPLNLFWAASALEIKVKATEVWVQLSADYDSVEPWVSVYFNKAPLCRFMVEKGEGRWVCIAKGLNPENENLITIYKATQPMTNDTHHALYIHQVGLNEDGVFCALPEAPLKLEFIGDSITSGEGLAGGPAEMDWVPAFFDGSKTYAAMLARNLNADFATFSQSGWGLCWGWDGNRHNKMPPFYEQVCGVMEADFQKGLGAHEPYNFNGGADFVILNLGTNDNGAFNQPAWKDPETGIEYKLRVDERGLASAEDGAFIKNAAKDFLTLIRKHNPEANIIWSWGMIKLAAVPYFIQLAVDEYIMETGDKKIYTLELDSMEENEKSDLDKGSRGHPGPLVHSLAAKKLEALIKSIKG